MAAKSIRQIRIEGQVAFVPLTQGKEAIIDASDVPKVSGLNWHTKPHGRTFYAISNVFKDDGAAKTTTRMHRYILNNPDRDVDHINGNGLDNRRSNLRECSHFENMKNKRPNGNRVSSPLKGAYRKHGRKNWYSEIRSDGARHYLGSFKTEIEAHNAYVNASKLLHGEFARIE